MVSTIPAFGLGAMSVLVTSWLWKQLRRLVFRAVSDRETGEQRRKSCPPSKDLSADYCTFLPGCFEVETSKGANLVNDRGFLTLRNGDNIFYQTWVPSSGTVDAGLVIIHGFGDECDFQKALMAKALASMGNLAVATFDLPGHGRSDGLHAYVPDWHLFVDAAREIIMDHLRPLLSKDRKDLKIFGLGESMGGGILFSMLVQEKEIFDGAILICPMLYVSRELFPPWIVVQIFRYLAVPLLPQWPVAPNKDIGAFLYQDPSVKAACERSAHSRIDLGGVPPRLATAYSLAFVAGEWMRHKIPEYDTPSLIFHGGGDVVTDPRVSQQLFADMAHADKEFNFPDGVWHADLFHGGPSQYNSNRKRYEAVVAWIKKRC
mmetsp:Transcript_96806/g.172226  ORF Transcript_96806/g.172226 Transcript_96806/m.172226 type:complete len:375 (+) Transcript_96806:65-1189(+)